MHQSGKFLQALKNCLKAKGVTYKLLAAKLRISETSVKRNFAEGSLSLPRIGEILATLELTFADVVKVMERGESRQDFLTFDQESILAGDKKLFVFFNLLLFG